MSKRERDEKEDEGCKEKRMKINEELDFVEILEILRKMKEKLKKVKEFLRSKYEKKCPVEKRSGGESHLHYAAFLGHVDATNVLLGNGADVRAVDDNIWTALHVAAKKGHADVAKVLIQNGADVNAVQKDKRQLFTTQVERDMLTLRKCCFRTVLTWTALHWTAQNGHADVAKVLLQNGADVNTVIEKDKFTALHLAAMPY
eukprot:g845.t1